ncbi:hypothetical protein FQN57_003872 [Myotisia sp. PD_48]|nr:hypothetical protein FQN57_003872 [Myotisia sp. PD_48]
MAQINFCTLGMFIIDEIEYEPPRPPMRDIIGGAGTFAAVGARIVAGQENSHRVGWVVDTGSDFPSHIRDQISSWNTHCLLRENVDRLTTRAWNGYGANEKRDFKYLTPKIQVDVTSLPETMVLSKTFHMVCSAERCYQITKGVLERREEIGKRHGLELSRPIFVWEPIPSLCLPEHLSKFYEVIRYIDVVSPNDLELATYFGNSTWHVNESRDQEIVQSIVTSGIGPEGTGTFVVRAGKDGCYAFSRGRKQLEIPAYYYAKVSDPTGAGNAFLGALCQALATPDCAPVSTIHEVLNQSKLWETVCKNWNDDGGIFSALICATIASSYVIEQVGVPILSFSPEGQELWNLTSYIERIRRYVQRLIHPQETAIEK